MSCASVGQTARAGFQLGVRAGSTLSPREEYRRVRSGQGLTDETRAVVGFFAIIVIGGFVLGSVDTNLDFTGLDSNYSDAAGQTSGGWLDYVNIAIVLPVVVVGGLMIAVLFRVF